MLSLLLAAAAGQNGALADSLEPLVAPDIYSGQPRGDSTSPALSADGRYLAFVSESNDIVEADNNGINDIFVYDSQSRTVFPVTTSADGASREPAISADGKIIAFSSDASNLVAADTNQTTDVFVYRHVGASLQRISVTSSGAQANGVSAQPAISSDGSFVAFTSSATNLVAGDSNDSADVFIVHLQTGQIQRVNVSSAGDQSDPTPVFAGNPAISADGRFVAFESSAANLVNNDGNGVRDIFLRDLTLATTERISVASDGAEANGSSNRPAISADGRWVAFSSSADNLIGDDGNEHSDVFVRDRTAGSTKRTGGDAIGRDSDNPAISGDGTIVAYARGAAVGVGTELWVYDAGTDGSRLIGRATASTSMQPSLNGDGERLAFASNDRNLVPNDIKQLALGGQVDVYLFDSADGDFEQASIADITLPRDNPFPVRAPALGNSGRFVAYVNRQPTIAQLQDGRRAVENVFLYDRNDQSSALISATAGGDHANNASDNPAVSGDEQHVAFDSIATDLVADDSNDRRDVFVQRLATGETVRVSSSLAGDQGDGDSAFPSISSDGMQVAFQSAATNLVAGDTNDSTDIFVRDFQRNVVERVSVDYDGIGGNGDSFAPAMSADSRFVAFVSAASNLAFQDTNSALDIFVYDRAFKSLQRISASSAGTPGNFQSVAVDIDDQGQFAAFQSYATNLVTGQANKFIWDIFIRNNDIGATDWVTRAAAGGQAEGDSRIPVISGDGKYLAFRSDADDLVADDVTAGAEIFVFERSTGLVRAIGARGSEIDFDQTGQTLAIGNDTSVVLWSSEPTGGGNSAPQSDAGRSQTVECSGPLTAVILDGSASVDPDGDTLSFSWRGPFGQDFGVAPTVQLPPGISFVELTATDPGGLSDTDTQSITVRDTTGPLIELSPSVALVATSADGAAFRLDPIVVDSCGGARIISVEPQLRVYPIGATTIIVTAEDDVGNLGVAQTVITVARDGGGGAGGGNDIFFDDFEASP